MPLAPKSQSQGSNAKIRAGVRVQPSQTRADAPAEWFAAQIEAGPERAESSMLQDIDAILSRLDDGIAKERKAIDELLERIRQPAA